MYRLTLGQKIRNARLEKNLTQKEVTGDFITRNALSAIENDAAKPSIKTLEYLAQKLDKPISYFLESIVSLDNNKKSNGDMIFEHSSLLLKNGEYESCILFIESKLKELVSDSHADIYGRIVYILSSCYVNTNKSHIAKKLLQDSIEILLSHNDHYFLAYCYYDLSVIYFINKEYDLSEDYSLKALESFGRSYVNDNLLEIKIHYTLGYSLYWQEKYDDAISHLVYAMGISKKYDCYYNGGVINMLLGIIYKKLNQVDKSIYFTQKAIVFFDFTDNHYLEFCCYKNMGNFFLSAKDYDRSLQSYNKALEYFEGEKSLLQINTIKVGIVEALTKKGSYLEAIKYSNSIDTEIISKFDKADLFKNLGKCYISLKDLPKAEKYLLDAEGMVIDSDRHILLYDMYSHLAELYSLREDYKKAYEFSTKAKSILDS